MRKVKFDIALSFAGEDREYVEQVAQLLKQKGVSVFYDLFEEADLWGKDLYVYLSDVYQNQALYTIMFISKFYLEKMWTDHERRSMQSRAFQESKEYILPVRFDETEIPGLLLTTGYISLVNKSPADLVEIILKKLILGGRTIPSENLRKSLSPVITVPKVDPKLLTICLEDEKGNPIESAKIVLVANNNTYLKQETGSTGLATFEINTRRSYKVFVSHTNYPSTIIPTIDPDLDLKVILHSSENIGSIICEAGTGYIPGLKGRLTPILDTAGRKYLYADNIAINGGQGQPTNFIINQAFDLEDCDGVIMQVTIRDIQGNCSILDYVSPIIQEL